MTDVIVCRVALPIIAPIVARPGELLVVRPDDADSLAVTDAQGRTELRRAAIPLGRLCDAVTALVRDAVVAPLTRVDVRELARLERTARAARGAAV